MMYLSPKNSTGKAHPGEQSWAQHKPQEQIKGITLEW